MCSKTSKWVWINIRKIHSLLFLWVLLMDKIPISTCGVRVWLCSYVLSVTGESWIYWTLVRFVWNLYISILFFEKYLIITLLTVTQKVVKVVIRFFLNVTVVLTVIIYCWTHVDRLLKDNEWMPLGNDNIFRKFCCGIYLVRTEKFEMLSKI